MKRLLIFCEGVLTYSAVVSTFSMMFLTTADTVGRYFLNSPIIGAYEVTEKYLMTTIVFLGICYAYHRGAYIRVTFLVDRLPRGGKVILNHLVQLLCFLLGLMFFVSTLQQAIHVIRDRVTLSVLALPLGPAYVIVPIGLFFLCLLLLIDLRRVKLGKSDLTKEETTAAEEAV